MTAVQFKALDLNLFRVLLALLEQGGVSAAAAELSVTPSAISHALNRLRAALDDPLFERRGGGLAPTAYALEVGRRARPALLALGEAIERPEFDPMRAEREFVLAAGAYASAVLFPPLIDRLAVVAPGVRLRVQPLTVASMDDVANRRVDLAISVESAAQNGLTWRALIADEVVWAARRDHPIMRDPLTEAMLSRVGHVVVERFGAVLGADHADLRELLDEITVLRGAYEAARGANRRRLSAIVPDMAQALHLAARSDSVTLTLRRLAEAAGRDDLQMLAPPRALPKLEIGAIYRPEKLRDPGFAWLLSMLEPPLGARADLRDRPLSSEA